MRIAIIADTYPPLRISGAVQMRDLVRTFADEGHEPTIIVPSSTLDRPWVIERDGRLTVLRVRTLATKDVGHIRRVIAEMLLPFILLRAVTASGLRSVRWDGVVWYAPTIFLGPLVRKLRRESGCRSYLILRDIFPEWAVDMGIMRRGLAYRFFKWVERRQYAVADTIGVQTPANMPYMAEWASKPDRTLEVLQNWLSPAAIKPCRIDISATRLAGRKILVYAGNMGVAQGMDVFIELVARMRTRTDVGFLFVGRGSDAARFAETAERQGLDNVVFHDEIEPVEIPGLLSQCYAGIVALDLRHKSHNIPGKFLTYMQAGMPVLARINPGNDLEQMINAERLGAVCSGGGVDELQRCLVRLLDDPALTEGVRERALAISERLFSSTAAVRQIVAALQPVPARTRPMSVLLLNQAFWPDVVATAQHADDLGQSLVAQGHEATAVASRAIYGEKGSTLKRLDQHCGVAIHRVGLQLFGKQGITPRTFDFALFYAAAAVRCLTLKRHDVVVCFTTPPFIALVGVLLRMVKGTKVVYWTMDLYPDVAGAAGLMRREGTLWRFLQSIDRFCLRHSDRVVVLGECMRDVIVRKGADPARVSVIPVWSGAEEFPARARTDNPLRAAWGIGDRFTILYTGNFGIGHDMEAIAGAVEALKDDDRIRWLFIGEGKAKPELERRIKACGARNVVLAGFQSREQLADVLDVGDSHLVSLLPGWEGLLLPSKFFSVLAAGKPVLWIGPDGTECGTILREHDCGFEVKPGDSSALTERIRWLIEHPEQAREMGGRGQAAYRERYCCAEACKHWHRVLSDVVGR
ncbi:MAG: glycosyltransferase family 4 protein [Phycisphaerae bacterium]|nr:glycosyltransferase family 4 protein [Phycisphaerae bacterium]